jgi:hypothetical protein
MRSNQAPERTAESAVVLVLTTMALAVVMIIAVFVVMVSDGVVKVTWARSRSVVCSNHTTSLVSAEVDRILRLDRICVFIVVAREAWVTSIL